MLCVVCARKSHYCFNDQTYFAEGTNQKCTIKEVPMSDTKANNSHIQIIIQKIKKSRIDIDLFCITMQLYLLNRYLKLKI